jgi:WD40 repeat protein
MILIATVILSLVGCNSIDPIPTITPSAPMGNATITIDNVSTLVELAKFSQGEMGPVTALAFTLGNTQLRAVHARTPMLRHWSVPDRKMVAEYELESVGLGAAAFDGTARSLVLSGVASVQASGSDYMTGISPEQLLGPYHGVEIIEAESGQLLSHLPGPGLVQSAFHGVAFSQDGRTVASQKMNLMGQPSVTPDQERGLHVFEISADRSAPASLLFSMTHSHSSFVAAFALGAEGRLLAAYADRGFIQLWDLESQREWGRLELSTNRSDTDREYYVTQMAIAPTRQWLVVFSFGPESFPDDYQQVTLWRLDKRQVQWQAEIDDRYVEAFAFNPSGTLLAAGGSNGVHIWNAETGEEVKAFPGEAAFAVAFSQDGSLLVWGDETGVVHLVGLPEN